MKFRIEGSQISLKSINETRVKMRIKSVLDSLKSSLKYKRLIMIPEESFMAIITNKYRVKILTLLSRGPLKASEIAKALKATRALVYKYLKDLESKGLVEKEGEYFKLSSAVYLVYRLRRGDKGIVFEINRDRAIFIDEKYGLIFVSQEGKDLEAICRNCAIVNLCTEEISSWAKKNKINISIEKFPAQNIVSVISQYIYDRLEKYLEKGYIVIRR
jgi:DNA-binding HxlR family transcriptional regulator